MLADRAAKRLNPSDAEVWDSRRFIGAPPDVVADRFVMASPSRALPASR